jgi:hypothetical protein
MGKDQIVEKLKLTGPGTRCGKKRIVYVPSAMSPKFFKIIKWLVLFIGIVVALMPTIFGLSMVVGTIGIVILFLDLCFWR